MWRYLAKRAIYAAVVIVGVVSVVFAVLRLSGDPVALFISPSDTTEEEIARVRHSFGFDRPVYVQYAAFFERAIRGDFGDSLQFRQPAMEITVDRLPSSLALAGASLAVAVGLALPIGVMGAVRRGHLVDRVLSLATGTAQAMPPFWLGLLLINLFAVRARWLPATGSGTPLHLVLPALTLGLYMMARTARLTRSAMLDVLVQDYLRTARAKGVAEALVIARHGLRNALVPILTISSITFASLLSNAIVIEAVFAWPGIGRLLIESVFARDYPVVQAAVIVISALVIVTNIVNDLLCALIDPRIRLQ